MDVELKYEEDCNIDYLTNMRYSAVLTISIIVRTNTKAYDENHVQFFILA